MPRLYVSPTTKALVPKLDLGDIDPDCKVYLFVFTGLNQLNPKLRAALTKYGKKTGKNLLVGFWADASRFYQVAVGSFVITKSPAIVITANSELAFMDGGLGQSVYARLDDEKLLQDDESVDLAMRTLDRLYLLFLNGKFKEAIEQVKKAQDKRKLQDFFQKLKDTFGSVGKFLSDHKIAIEFGSFRFSIEPTER